MPGLIIASVILVVIVFVTVWVSTLSEKDQRAMGVKLRRKDD